jgi:hypothetical protein
MTMSLWMSAPALGLAAALTATSLQDPATAPPASRPAPADEKPTKLSLDLRVTPPVSFAPSRVRALVEVKIPEDRVAEFYCAQVEWDWGDLTESAESNDCEPYEPGVSEVRRRFSAEHTFQSGGRYRVQFRLRRNRKVLASTSVMVTVRAGLRDVTQPFDGPEP